MPDDIAAEALRFATEAHASIDHRRKYTGEPYIVHPVAVAKIVRTVPHDENMIAAAYLHDVVEDTPVSIEEIEAAFGEDVASLVGWLTDVSKPSDGNRRTRKDIDLRHSAAAPARAQTIKLADLIDNTDTIRERDPDFWKVYRREKLRLLDAMKDGDRTLWQIAYDKASRP